MQDTARIMVALMGQNAVGLDVDSGGTLWTRKLPFTPIAFVCHEDVVLCTGQGEVCAVSMAGDVLWHNELPGMGVHAVLLAVPSVTKSGRL